MTIFRESNECIALYSKFDITTGAALLMKLEMLFLITFIVMLLLDNQCVIVFVYFNVLL